MALQELKTPTDDFPGEALRAAGYASLAVGQRTWNGVALLARGHELVEVARRLPGDSQDKEARYVEAAVNGVLFGCLYLPNGNPPNTDKYTYKISWMDRLIQYSKARLKLEEKFVLAGDFNVIPAPGDARFPDAWKTDALFLPQTREKFRALLNLGLTDAIRAVSDDPGLYSFWDYQAGSWQKNDGIRIDHLLLSPQAE